MKGLALIVVAGLLTLLAAAGSAWIHFAAGLRGMEDLALDRLQARLLAGSGLQYACARLYQDVSAKAQPTVLNQPDDWTFRDPPGTALERARNPSYAQTEPYQERGTADGKYDAGIDTYADLDGNGRFDSWSGRLRSRHGMTGGTFALDVSGRNTEGGLNINAGYLGDPADMDINRNGIPDYRDLGRPDQGSTWTMFPAGNIQPGWDLKESLARNRKVAYAINQLGTLLGLARSQMAEVDVGLRRSDNIVTVGAAEKIANAQMDAAGVPAGAAFSSQRAGDLIVLNRPAGGYRSLEEVGRLFLPPEWEILKPHLSVIGRRNRVAAYAKMPNLSSDYYVGHEEWYEPDIGYQVHPGAASLEVLAAPLCGLGEKRVAVGLGGHLYSGDAIGPDEALAAARFLKEEPFASRQDLYLKLREKADALFRYSPDTDPGYLFWHGPDVRTPSDVRKFKASLAWGLVSPEELGAYGMGLGWTGGRVTGGFWSWIGYDAGWPIRVVKGYTLDRELSASGGIGLDMEPLSLFSIESLGRCRGGAGNRLASASSLSGIVQVRDRIDAQTQQDFENVAYPGGAARVGSRFGRGTAQGRPSRNRATTAPCFSMDAMPDLQGDTRFGYCPHYGELMLLDRSWMDGRESFYQPRWDLDQPERPPGFGGKTMENFRNSAVSRDEWPAMFSDPGNVRDPGYYLLGVRDCLNSGDVLMPEFPGELSGAWPFSGAHRFLWEDCREAPLGGADGALRKGVVEGWFSWSKWGWDAYDNSVRGYASPVATVPGWWGYGDYQAQSYYRSRFRWGPGDYYYDKNAEWHNPNWPQDPLMTFASFVFDADAAPGMNIYFDGIWQAGADFDPIAQMDPFEMYLWDLDDCRIYREPPPAAQILVRALKGRYWVPLPDADPPGVGRPDLREVPGFVSPLYRFDGKGTLTSAGWNGFVPDPIWRATDQWNSDHPHEAKIPLQVELLLYAQEGEPPKVVPLPPGSWRTGGCRIDFDAIAPVEALRYRVRLDASAVDGCNKQTPVFDSISISYRSNRLLQYQ